MRARRGSTRRFEPDFRRDGRRFVRAAITRAAARSAAGALPLRCRSFEIRHICKSGYRDSKFERADSIQPQNHHAPGKALAKPTPERAQCVQSRPGIAADKDIRHDQCVRGVARFRRTLARARRRHLRSAWRRRGAAPVSGRGQSRATGSARAPAQALSRDAAAHTFALRTCCGRD
jgi:hypothetical protein